MKNFALIGSGIKESLSPKLWRFFAEKTGAELIYGLCDLPADVGDETLLEIVMKYDGANITSPFKNKVAEILNFDGPVNTVSNKNGRFLGCSTDGFGTVYALETSGIDVRGKKLTVVGAGGAAESAVEALLSEGADVSVLDRTQSKAERLSEKYGLACAPEKPFGVLVFMPENADLSFAEKQTENAEFVFDANYKHESALLRRAKDKGKTAINGLSMLFYQGAASFEIFTGIWLENPEILCGEFIKLL